MTEQTERKQQALAILQDADRELEGWSCDSSTECCRFAITGREPWVTQVEWQLVVDETARQGRRLPPMPTSDDERCPFLAPLPAGSAAAGKAKHEGGRCTVYASRPLGCRTFFCERARDNDGNQGPPSTSTRELREAARSLDALKTREGAGDDDGKARPLRSWLRAALGSKMRSKISARR